MTSVGRRVGLGLLIGSLAQAGVSASNRQDTQPGAAAPSPAVIRPPAALRDQIVALSRAFDGKAGISIIRTCRMGMR